MTKSMKSMATVLVLLMVLSLGYLHVGALKEKNREITQIGEKVNTLDLPIDDRGKVMEVDLPVKSKVQKAEVTIQGVLPPIIDDYDVGSDPRSITGSDVDGDGDVDLGISNAKSDSISILMNDGKGGFGRTGALDFMVDRGPYDLVLEDLDGDGNVDLATANYDDESVTVRLSKEDMFGSMATYTIDGSPEFILSGDMDGDSYVDLVIIRKEFPVVAILFNRGDGTFNPSMDVEVVATPTGGILEDLDMDGDLDIIITSTDSPFSVIMVENRGSKDLVEGEHFELDYLPNGIVSADLSGDGLSEIVVSSTEGNVTVLESEGVGTDYSPGKILYYEDQKSLFAIDLDNDGRTDLVSVARVDSTVRVFHNREGVDGYELVLDEIFIMGDNPNDVFLGDLDEDGDPDLTVPNLATDTVSVVMNNGRGRFSWYETSHIMDSDKIVNIGDIDGDGDQDVISSNYNQQTVTLIYNKGRGDFDEVVLRDGYRVYPDEGGAGASEPFYISTADYDNDGDIDIEYGEELTYSIIMMFNEGDGEFREESVAFVNDSNLLPAPPFITLPVDVDLDGDKDIVCNHVNHDFLSILLNDGTGHFKQRINHSLEGSHPYDMVTRDIDGDGDMDFVTADFGKSLDFENTISFIRNEGDGTFSNLGNLTVKKGPRSLEMADLDGDGNLDLVVAFAARKGLSDIVPGEIAVIRGKDGVLAFEDPEYYRAGILPGSLFLINLNDDEFPDVLCLNQGTGTGGSISLFINEGDGDLMAQILYPDIPFATGVVHDFLGDGRGELILPILSTHLALYRYLYFPGNVSMTIGNTSVGQWEGVFSSRRVVNLTGAMNEYLEAKREEGVKGNISVPIRARADKAGYLKLSELDIQYKMVEGEEEKVGEPGQIDLSDPNTYILFVMLGVLVIGSLLIAAPRSPKSIELPVMEKKKKRKKKRTERKVKPKERVQVMESKGKRKSREMRRKMRRATHLREELARKESSEKGSSEE